MWQIFVTLFQKLPVISSRISGALPWHIFAMLFSKSQYMFSYCKKKCAIGPYMVCGPLLHFWTDYCWIWWRK
jgi:hypothetical protein